MLAERRKQVCHLLHHLMPTLSSSPFVYIRFALVLLYPFPTNATSTASQLQACKPQCKTHHNCRHLGDIQKCPGICRQTSWIFWRPNPDCCNSMELRWFLLIWLPGSREVRPGKPQLQSGRAPAADTSVIQTRVA